MSLLDCSEVLNCIARIAIVTASLLPVLQGPIWTMAFSKTGMYLATGGNDKKVIVWEAVTAGSSDMHSAQDSSSVATATEKSDLPDEGGVGML
jgi:WD40 repeat protein